MSSFYIQKNPWRNFSYNDSIYDLSHLNEHSIEVFDSKNVKRSILVTYTDHCFTEDMSQDDDPVLEYPGSSRGRGCFSIERYKCSLALPEYIATVSKSKIWVVEGSNFALIPIITHEGIKVLYAIIFSLDPIKGLPFALHMRVSTAYPQTESDITTYGNVRFVHLVTLRMQKKYPGRILDKHRQKPMIK